MRGATLLGLVQVCLGAPSKLLDPSKLEPPPVCYETAPKHVDAIHSSEEDSRRVALLVRGESFRGVHMGLMSDIKRDVVCLPAAYEIQKACSENLVASVIEGFEAQGVAVDVLASGREGSGGFL